MRPRIALIGSYATECSFYTEDEQFIENCFDICFVQRDLSFLSLMSKQFEGLERNLEFSDDEDQMFEREFSGTVIDELIKSSPDYIVIDFHGDALGVIDDGKGGYLTLNRMVKNRYCGDVGKYELHTPFHEREKYIEKFLTNFIEFKRKVEKEIPGVSFILHCIEVMTEFDKEVPEGFVDFHMANQVNLGLTLLEDAVKSLKMDTIDIFPYQWHYAERRAKLDYPLLNYSKRYKQVFMKYFYRFFAEKYWNGLSEKK